MRRSPNSKKEEVLKRGPWTVEEDKILTAYIQQNGHGSWRALPEKAGLKRCGKSCRLRWINYLRPDIKRGKFSLQEEQTIIQLHALLGNRWSAMAGHLPKRTDNEIKNHWNTHLKKRLIKMGIDPMTHKPARTNADSSFPSAGSGSATKNASNLSHMAQWESARLEAEARLVRESSSKQVVPPKPNPTQTQTQVIQPKNKLTPRPNLTQLMINNTNSRPRCLDVLKAWQGVVAGMFAFSSQDLESPTSTLSFPDGTNSSCDTLNSGDGMNSGLGRSATVQYQVQAPVIGSTSGYTDIEIGWGYEKSNQMQELHGMMTGSGDDHDAWFEDSMFNIGNENVDVPANYNMANLMEGLLSDDLVFSSAAAGHVLNNNNAAPMATVEKSTTDQSCSGNITENGNCWDSVLNLVNSSPYGSPVF